MTKIELTYTEIDGLLYPNIEIVGKALLRQLGKVRNPAASLSA